MASIKILTIIGARPQIIKAAALSRAIAKSFSDRISETILHTGQHYDKNMSDVFFRELEIPNPDFNLHVGSGTHGEQTAKMITGIAEILESEKFDALVVFGDTNSTLAGAVAGAKMNIPVVHIEAGLRSFNMSMPEEQNRIVCDHLSSLLFAPTETGMKNLEREGLINSPASFANGKTRKAYNSGDIMYDNNLFFADIAETKTDIIPRLNLTDTEYILVTVHRNNNTDNPERLTSIFSALIEISETEKKQIILPMHPRTTKVLEENLCRDIFDNIQKSNYIKIIPPVSFFEMTALEKNAQMIMTDSGGVQKEAYFFKKPCVILRPETEWVEITENKAGIIADADIYKITDAYYFLSKSNPDFPPVFGNGNAAEFMLNKMIC